MPSRRTILSGSAAVAAALAGCAGLGNDSDDGTDTPDGGVDDGSPLRWLPAPDGGATASFSANDVREVRELADSVDDYDPERMPPVRYAPDPVGVELAALDAVVHTSWSFQQAVRAEFDRSAVESRLDDEEDYERAETTAGFALYAGGNVDVAVGDGHVCWSASNLDDGVDPTLTRAVEAKAGDGTRALAANDRLSSLADHLEPGLRYAGEAAAEGTLDWNVGGPVVARGGWTTLDGETMTTEHLLLYDEAADVPEGDAREQLREDLAALSSLLDPADVTVEVDGTALRATGSYEAAAWVDVVREQTGATTTADG